MKELNGKLNEIIKMKWIKLENNNDFGKVGNYLEKILGLNNNSFSIPDFNGIEIKTKYSRSSSFISMFNMTPDNSVFEIKRIVETFGYPDKDYPEYNVFLVSVFCNKWLEHSKYIYKLCVDRKEKIIKLLVFDKNYDLIEDKISWSFNELEERMKRKLSNLCYVTATKKKVYSDIYVKFNKATFYKYNDFEKFLKCFESGKIRINFKISVFKGQYRHGQIHDRGTSFEINEDCLECLFDKVSF